MKPPRLRRTLRLLLFLLAGIAARATPTENNGIHAVPTPGPVTIDGRLDDWDLSGQVFMCHDIEALKDIYSARVAAMYDAQNLYLAIHWADPDPMCNSRDPRYDADKGGTGDSVQFRIKTDRISNVTCWYCAPNREPAIRFNYGTDLTHPDGGGSKQLFQVAGWKLTGDAEEAFLKDADGKGYVQEIKLPWKLITLNKKYQAGDSFNLGVELTWGPGDSPARHFADNLAGGSAGDESFSTDIPAWGPLDLEPQGWWELPEPGYAKALVAESRPAAPGPVEITYTLPEDARVTLAIDDPSGRRIRNLVAAQPRQKGVVTEHWDGLDDDGKPVPAGPYHFKALYHDGIHVKYAMSFANPGHPTWETPDGRGAFYADDTAPEAVAAAGDYVALGCPVGEAGRPLIACDLNGQRLWGQANRTLLAGGRMSLATDGKILWVSQDQTGTIYRVDLATGRYAPWDCPSTDASGAVFRVLDLPVYDAGKKTMQESMLLPNLTAISVNDHLLAACLFKDGVIELLDKESGLVKTRLTVPAPVTAVFDGEDGVVALSNDHLVRVGLDGKITPLGDASYPDGYGLALDARRNIYLSVRGADQNVKVLSPDGKPLREIGKLGGRPLEGEFDDAGMRNPAQIAVDRTGRLWVAEETKNPKRTSVWDTETGELVKDLSGTTSKAGAGALDPFDPATGFSDDTVYQLDWSRGVAWPKWSLGQKNGLDDLFPVHVDSPANRVLQHEGTLYVYTGGAGAEGSLVRCAIYRDGAWRSAAVVGLVPREGAPGMEELTSNPLFAGHAGELFSWIDRNGDGRVQENELTFFQPTQDGKPLDLRGNEWSRLPDDQGTITYCDATGTMLVKFPVTDYAPDGAPMYDITSPVVVPITARLNYGEGMILGGKDGRTYVNQDPLTAFDQDGKQLFTYPNRYLSVSGSRHAPPARPGLLIGPSSFYGVADLGGDTGEVFCLNGSLGENYLFTWDGLFIQSLFKDCRDLFTVPGQAAPGESFDDATAGGESGGGNFVRTPDGKTYLVIGGTDARVLEVTGLDRIKRLAGGFIYTPEQFAAARQAAGKPMEEMKTPKACVIAKSLAPVVIDGKPDEWLELNDVMKSLIEIGESADASFARVTARYDDKNLYLACHVLTGDKKMRNAGRDFQQLFQTGDAVDLMLGPERQNRDGAGDLRLLFSVVGGRPVAVLYEKRARGVAGRDKVAFGSPWRTIYFDRVTQPGDVRVAVGPYPGARGYFLEAAVPWSRLGLKPSSGLKLKADFGILSANAGGTTTVARVYWNNPATGKADDLPDAAQLEPDRWGDVTLQ
jgi:hypothetical protein